jgi:hypothetical protein
MCGGYGFEGETRAAKPWARFTRGLVKAVLHSVLFSESRLILFRLSQVLDFCEMGARPPMADSVRE